ncbi:hypothetical protein E8E14_006414 [Neopestalotiopsis sp. 37M]|nr:hypothetical protein E8E14_006414 [Neopestalotiopsis sp. 37M]
MMALQSNDNGRICLAASWAMFAITLIFVVLRLYCRRFHGPRQWGLDDYITAFTMVIFCFSLVLFSLSVNYGLGRRYAEVSTSDAEQALYWFVMLSAVSIWTFSLPKLAIVALIQRLLNIRTLSWTGGLMWTLAALGQAFIFVVSVLWYKQCQPVAYQWDRSLEGSCPRHAALENWGYVSSAYSAFLDVLFALYPIPSIMRLNMSLRRRLSISVALGLSSIGCAVSIVKIVQLIKVLPVLATDPLYPMPYLFVLLFAETMVLITCASIPTLGPIFYRLKGKVSSYRGRSKDDGSGQTSGQSRSNQYTLITFGGSNWKNKSTAKQGHSTAANMSSTAAEGSDEVPLARVESVSAHGIQSEAASISEEGIRKTTEISVRSEMGRG